MSQKFLQDSFKNGLIRIFSNGESMGTGIVLGDEYVVTCFHCIDALPDSMTLGTEPLFVGLGLDEQTTYGEVVFIDPCTDLAVINCASDFYEMTADYDELLNTRTNMNIAEQEGMIDFKVFIPGFDGSCLRGRAMFCGLYGINVRFDGEADRALPGMSGSPILNSNGHVVGILKSGSLNQPSADGSVVAKCLPKWLYREILG